MHVLYDHITDMKLDKQKEFHPVITVVHSIHGLQHFKKQNMLTQKVHYHPSI